MRPSTFYVNSRNPCQKGGQCGVLGVLSFSKRCPNMSPLSWEIHPEIEGAAGRAARFSTSTCWAGPGFYASGKGRGEDCRACTI